jgi:hypothetical protein
MMALHPLTEWIAALPERRRAEALAELDAAIRAGETPAELPVHVIIGLTAPA